MSPSVSQISLVLAVVSILFTLAMVAVVVFGVLKTGGATRTLILLAGGLMLVSQLVSRSLPFLLQGLGVSDRLLVIVAPTIVVGLFGLASTACLVFAAVRAWGERQLPRPERPQHPGWQDSPSNWQGTQPPPRDPR